MAQQLMSQPIKSIFWHILQREIAARKANKALTQHQQSRL
jgi:hypothetical protein